MRIKLRKTKYNISILFLGGGAMYANGNNLNNKIFEK